MTQSINEVAKLGASNRWKNASAEDKRDHAKLMQLARENNPKSHSIRLTSKGWSGMRGCKIVLRFGQDADRAIKWFEHETSLKQATAQMEANP